MITADEIRDKAKRLYPLAVQAYLKGEAFFPRSVPCNLRPSKIFSEAAQQEAGLRAGSKEVRGFGYCVQWESRNSRLYSLQDFAVGISFETLEDLLRLIGKVTEFRQLTHAVETIRTRKPSLRAWAITNWRRLLAIREQLSQLLDVVDYLSEHPRPNCFIRELPLAISTKLIEDHSSVVAQWLDILIPHSVDFGFDREQFAERYGFRAVDDQLLLRILDPSMLKELNCPSNEIGLPVSSLSAMPVRDVKLFIVENKINLLTLPMMPRTLALGGLGKGVTRLFRIPWLESASLVYWGDLDVEGLQMLAMFRNRYPQTRSLMMDIDALERFRSLAIKGNDYPADLMVPSELTEQEAEAFIVCRTNSLRIEQERIPQNDINRVLSR